MSDLPSVGELVTNSVELYVMESSASETKAVLSGSSICFWLPADEIMILFTFDEKSNIKLLTRFGFAWISPAWSFLLMRCTDE